MVSCEITRLGPKVQNNTVPDGKENGGLVKLENMESDDGRPEVTRRSWQCSLTCHWASKCWDGVDSCGEWRLGCGE